MSVVWENFLYPISPVLGLLVGALMVMALELVGGPALKPLRKLAALTGPILSIYCVVTMQSHWPIQFASLGFTGEPLWLAEFSRSYRLDNLSLGFYWAINLFLFFFLVFLDPYLDEN